MSDLYWISVLGTLSDVSSMFCFILGAATIVFFAWTVVVMIDDSIDDKFHRTPKKCLKYFTILFSVFLVINIFVPSKNDLYTIYGVGATIDYCKNNSDVKELPDNAVKALNAYLKHIEKYNTDSNNENPETGHPNN